MAVKTASRPRCRKRKNVAEGNAYIKSTFDNTIASITDPTGTVIAPASSGQVGFKGLRKSAPSMAQLATETAACRTQKYGMKKVDIYIKEPGFSRETTIRSLQVTGLEMDSIQGVTPQARNNCRPPKRRCA